MVCFSYGRLLRSFKTACCTTSFALYSNAEKSLSRIFSLTKNPIPPRPPVSHEKVASSRNSSVSQVRSSNGVRFSIGCLKVISRIARHNCSPREVNTQFLCLGSMSLKATTFDVFISTLAPVQWTMLEELFDGGSIENRERIYTDHFMVCLLFSTQCAKQNRLFHGPILK